MGKKQCMEQRFASRENRDCFLSYLCHFFCFCFRSLEDELINTSMLLAEKYDIPVWEVMLSHVEYLFTDSG